MSTVTQEPEQITGELVTGNIEAPIRFDVTNEAIHYLRKKLTGLKASTPEGYKQVQAGIAETRSLRVSVESTRKALKEKALTYGRLVDGEARRITTLLEEIEEPLKQEKEAADAAKAKAKAEAEEAKRVALQGRIDSLVAVGAMVHPLVVGEWTEERFQEELTKATEAFKATQARLAAEKAEAERLEAERLERLRIEQERIAAERAELERLREEQAAREWEEQVRKQIERERVEAEQAIERKRLADEKARIDEENRIEREAIEAQRKAVQAERDELDRQEFLRQSKIREEHEAAERAKQERMEAERIAADKAEQERLALIAAAEEAARLDAMKPDVEKIRAFGDMLRLLAYPVLSTEEGIAFLQSIKQSIDAQAMYCEGFGA
jgi:hypothetical protein